MTSLRNDDVRVIQCQIVESVDRQTERCRISVGMISKRTQTEINTVEIKAPLEILRIQITISIN